jgi:hypothetical protein
VVWPLSKPRRRSVVGISGLRLLVAVLAFCAGCASPRDKTAGPRPFKFGSDSFAYANELVWEYHHDASGRWTHRRRQPPPEYTHHCFVVVRAARQFFELARFDPAQPRASDAVYRGLIRRVMSCSPRAVATAAGRVIIPGYADLRAFSAERGKLLQAECGGAWESYCQRGHWRCILPFTRGGQAGVAEELVRDLERNRPPIVHLIRFPQLSINHAVLLFDAQESADQIRFLAYDPNKPDSPGVLTFNRATQWFDFPGNDYYRGGRVNVYEVYRGGPY